MQLIRKELGNAVLKKQSSLDLLDFVKMNSFCTFLTFNKNALSLSHINLIQHEDKFFGHLSKANSQAKGLEDGSKILAIFKESSEKTQAVHMHGTVHLIHDENQMIEMMSKLVAKYESDKPKPWAVDWTDSRFKSQLKGIVGFYVTPTLIEEATIKPEDAQDSLMNVAISVDMGNVLEKAVPIYKPQYFSENASDKLDIFIKNNASCSVVAYNDTEFLHVYHLQQTDSQRKEDTFTIQGSMICPESQTPLKSGETFKTVLIFNGPHSYISPSWYKTPCSVPTWNYTVAHAHGTLQVAEHCGMRVTLKCDITNMDGKFKLNQNRTTEDKQGVVDGLSLSSCPMEKEVAEMMRTHSFSNNS